MICLSSELIKLVSTAPAWSLWWFGSNLLWVSWSVSSLVLSKLVCVRGEESFDFERGSHLVDISRLWRGKWCRRKIFPCKLSGQRRRREKVKTIEEKSILASDPELCALPSPILHHLSQTLWQAQISPRWKLEEATIDGALNVPGWKNSAMIFKYFLLLQFFTQTSKYSHNWTEPLYNQRNEEYG